LIIILEMIFPSLVVGWLASFGWRSGWAFLAFLLVLIFLPLSFWLIRFEPNPSHHVEVPVEVPLTASTRSWTLGEVLRDWRFWTLLLPVLVTPAFLTGLFFHQAAVMEWKNWNLAAVPLGFIVYALVRATMSFWAGPLTDRFTARKIFPLNLLPLALGFFALAAGGSSGWMFFYFAGAGMTMGHGMTVGNALFAELYGTRNLGSIRGVVSFSIIFSTALAPLVMGHFLDSAVSLGQILSGMISFCVLGVFMTWWALRVRPVAVSQNCPENEK